MSLAAQIMIPPDAVAGPASALTRDIVAALLSVDVMEVNVEPLRRLEQSDVTVVTVSAAAPPKTRQFLHKYTSLEEQRRNRSARSDAAWAATARSFANEADFLSAVPVDSLRARGAYIPRPVMVALRSGHSPALDQECATLTEYLDPAEWHQTHVLDCAQACAAVRWLAAFHAHFFKYPLPAGVLETGCWWKQQPDALFESLPAVYAHLMGVFASDSDRDLHIAEGTAAYLECLSRPATREWICSELDRSGVLTLVHGDFKPSNLFFRARHGGPAANSSLADGAVAAIDFQWTGPGRSGAADLAYFLCGSVEGRFMLPEAAAEAGGGGGVVASPASRDGASPLEEQDGDLWLVAEYFQTLQRQLESAGSSQGVAKGDAVPSWPLFLRLFKLELMDYVKTALPYLHAGMTRGDFDANATRYGFLTHEHDTRVMMWMCRKAASYTRELIPFGAELGAV